MKLEFQFRCLECGAIVPDAAVKFEKSRTYSREYRGSGAPRTKVDLEISTCPACGTRKGFTCEYTGDYQRPHALKDGPAPGIVDLFCGCGGLSEGFQQAGFRPVVGLDVNKPMIQTFAVNHPGARAIVGDINAISAGDLVGGTASAGGEPGQEVGENHQVHVVVGGPPCQGFSTVGDRFAADPRNRLFYQFLRVVSALTPTAVLMENVPGLLSMKGGQVSDIIRHELASRGYRVAVKRLLATNFGVPQKRERVFFLGLSGAVPASVDPEEVLPERGPDAADGGSPITVAEAIGDLPPLGPGEGCLVSEYAGAPTTSYQRAMRARATALFNHVSSRHSALVLRRINALAEGQNHQDLPAELQLQSGYPNIYGRLWRDRPSDVITGNYGCVSAPGRFIHPTQPRVLSVREGARLQSFPDDFLVVGSSKSIRYKQVGNAVPPLLARAIARAIARILPAA